MSLLLSSVRRFSRSVGGTVRHSLYGRSLLALFRHGTVLDPWSRDNNSNKVTLAMDMGVRLDFLDTYSGKVRVFWALSGINLDKYPIRPSTVAARPR